MIEPRPRDAALADAVAAAMEDPEARCGPYLLLGKLAAGSFGEVFRAFDPRAERVVALKQLTNLGANARARFLREVQATRRLEHPHIVAVLDHGEHARRPYLVMDLVDGEPLSALAPLEPGRAAKVLAAVARAAAHAHDQGVLHRDLKPGNVLVAAGDHAWVVDFGLARFTLSRGPKLTRTGEMVGSPLFMAPEQSAGVFDERAEVYALGTMLYFALTGRPPLEAATLDDYLDQLAREHPPPPSARRAGVPAALDWVCLRCLEKDPQRRYAGAAEVADELERFLGGQPTLAGPPPLATRLGRWAHRQRVMLALALLALSAVGLFALLAARSP